MNLIADNELRQIATQALSAKGKLSSRKMVFIDQRPQVGRKKLTFPKLSFDHSSKYHASYYDDVKSFLETWEVRVLNDVRKAGFETPTEDQLADLFERHVRASLTTGVGLSDKSISHLCSQRAQRALMGWKPDYITKMVEAGRRGGLKSKRHTDPEIVQIILANPAMRATALGKLVSRSRSQVTRIRMKYTNPVEVDHWSDLEPPAEWHADAVDDWDLEDVSENRATPVVDDWNLEDVSENKATPDVDDWNLEDVSENKATSDVEDWDLEDEFLLNEAMRVQLFDPTPMEELAIQTRADTYDHEAEAAKAACERSENRSSAGSCSAFLRSPVRLRGWLLCLASTATAVPHRCLRMMPPRCHRPQLWRPTSAGPGVWRNEAGPVGARLA